MKKAIKDLVGIVFWISVAITTLRGWFGLGADLGKWLLHRAKTRHS